MRSLVCLLIKLQYQRHYMDLNERKDVFYIGTVPTVLPQLAEVVRILTMIHGDPRAVGNCLVT